MPEHAAVREMVASDATAVAALLPDLGYEATPAQVDERFAQLLARPDIGFFVATCNGTVIAWLHVYGVRLLESDGYAEIGGVVVLARHQRQGIGSQLIRCSEQWAAQRDYRRVRLRSGVQREAAHRFYEALGYAKSRASFAFERRIDPDPQP